MVAGYVGITLGGSWERANMIDEMMSDFQILEEQTKASLDIAMHQYASTKAILSGNDAANHNMAKLQAGKGGKRNNKTKQYQTLCLKNCGTFVIRFNPHSLSVNHMQSQISNVECASLFALLVGDLSKFQTFESTETGTYHWRIHSWLKE